MTEKARFRLRSTARIGQLLAGLGMYSAAACAQTPPAETGIWLDDTGAGAVEIYVCADRADRLCGRIIWLKEPLNAQGVPKHDRYNPNEALQGRPICGLSILGNLAKLPEGGFDGGWIYDPKAGKSYSAAIELARQDRLTVTGYVGLKFLSKTFTWTRAPADLQRCEGAPGPQSIKATKPSAAPAKPATSASASPAKAPASKDAAMLAPASPPPAPKPAVSTATAAPAPKPGAAAAKPLAATAPPKAATAATAGSAAKKGTTTTAAAASASKPATGAKPVTGSAASKTATATAKPAPSAATATSATTTAKTATATATPNAASAASAKKPKAAPVEADSNPIPGPFSWSGDVGQN
jgi:uncharacterized protein (DUF2147 family)